MDGLTPDASMPASAEAASLPSEAPVSATVQPEAPATGEVAAQHDQVSAESVPAESLELPDEQAFEQLSGPERGNNWKQARARIAELNEQVKQFSSYQPVLEQIEQMGGWEAAQQYADLGALLFSQVQGENGEIQLTAEPLIARLADESPSTLEEIVWKGIHQPDPRNPNQTLKDAIVSEVLGLNPALLDTYKQIQNPADVQKFQAPGQISAEELAEYPEELHNAYKSLTPRQREELNLAADHETKLEFLQDKADALKAREFIAQQEAERERQAQLAQQQFQQRVEQRGTEIGAAARDAALANARQRLQTEATFSADAEVNETVHNECIQWAVTQCLSDPSLAQDNDRADALYKLSADAELRGEKMKAAQYKAQADNLAKKLEGRFLNNLTKRTAFWSKALGSARQATQQQVEQARPRTEVAASNASPRQTQQTQTVGHGFQPTPQRLAQYEAMLRAATMQNG